MRIRGPRGRQTYPLVVERRRLQVGNHAGHRVLGLPREEGLGRRNLSSHRGSCGCAGQQHAHGLNPWRRDAIACARPSRATPRARSRATSELFMVKQVVKGRRNELEKIATNSNKK